jgi:hypothetical protein
MDSRPSALGDVRRPPSQRAHIVIRLKRSEEPFVRTVRLGLGLFWALAAILSLAAVVVSTGRGAGPIPLWGWRLGVWTGALLPRNGWLGWSLLVVEIGVAALLFISDPRFRRAALTASALTGITLWSLSGSPAALVSGSASLLNGAPGTMLLVSAASVLLLWPFPYENDRRRALGYLVAATLLLGALLQLAPGFWNARGAEASFLAAASAPQPAFLSGAERGVASLLAQHPALVNALLVVLMSTLAVLLAVRPRHTAPTIATILFLATTWWLGQDLGVFWAGLGRDLGSAPMLVFLLAVAWTPRRRRRVSNVFRLSVSA